MSSTMSAKIYLRGAYRAPAKKVYCSCKHYTPGGSGSCVASALNYDAATNVPVCHILIAIWSRSSVVAPHQK